MAIEVDGFGHDMGDQPWRDRIWTKLLEENGYRVLRVSAKRIFAAAIGTAEAIVARIGSLLYRPSDGPPPRIGEVK